MKVFLFLILPLVFAPSAFGQSATPKLNERHSVKVETTQKNISLARAILQGVYQGVIAGSVGGVITPTVNTTPLSKSLLKLSTHSIIKVQKGN